MQTRAIAVVRGLLQVIETGNLDEVKHHLSGDFILGLGTRHPLNKYQFLHLLAAVKRSVSDLAFSILALHEDHQSAQSDRVHAEVQAISLSRLIRQGI